MKQKVGSLKKKKKIDRPVVSLSKMRRKNPNQKCKKGDNNKYHGSPRYHKTLL
jgi:hypothetical protein